MFRPVQAHLFRGVRACSAGSAAPLASGLWLWVHNNNKSMSHSARLLSTKGSCKQPCSRSVEGYCGKGGSLEVLGDTPLGGAASLEVWGGLPSHKGE